MSENHNNHNGNGNGHHPDPDPEELYPISERARNNPGFNPVAAAYVRKLAAENRKNPKPFDREKFEEFIKNDPILSNMKNIPFDDD